MDPGIAFGRVLRRYRRAAGLTQEQLALEADVQRNYVSLMERGRNQPTITTIFKLAKALDCAPGVMVSAVEEECAHA
ncbi:helix-turn-helix domain-containing protein [Burkholderia pyrrocinia]